MAEFLKQHYGTCEGPLGIPCLERQARSLDELLRKLPHDEMYEPGHLVIAKATTELLPGERADVSWISTEDPDRMRDVVLARGMNDEHFKLNPLVTLQHAYWLPPVGRSLWRRRVKDGERMGVKAKTLYPSRPESWPQGAPWPPDTVFPLVQAGLLCGKSIGFLPTRVRTPTDEEIRRRPELVQVKRVVEEWVLLGRQVDAGVLQQHAVVEAVSKGLSLPEDYRRAMNLPQLPVVAFTPLDQIERYIRRRLEQIDFERLARNAVSDALDRARGRV
jgi:hypothetical protein